MENYYTLHISKNTESTGQCSFILKLVTSLGPTLLITSLLDKVTYGRCSVDENGSCTDGGNQQGHYLVDGYERVQNALENEDNYDNFMETLWDRYHFTGHLLVGIHCRTNPDTHPETGFPIHVSLIGTTAMAGRDPIFYRWHLHLEELNQQFRDTKLPTYKEEDFQLTQGVRVVNAKTVLENPVVGSLDNILLTYMENAELNYGHNTQISYPRVNHHRFKYEIELENPERTNKKVIVRLFLGIEQDHIDRY